LFQLFLFIGALVSCEPSWCEHPESHNVRMSQQRCKCILLFLLLEITTLSVASIGTDDALSIPNTRRMINGHSNINSREEINAKANTDSDGVSSYDTPSVLTATGSNLIEVYEHEFYDTGRQAWIGGSSPDVTHRWTSSPKTTEPTKYLPPPPQIPPPKGYDYTSEWKIEITGSSSIRDELGWEYFINNKEIIYEKSDSNQSIITHGRRRRRWLRSVALTEANVDGVREIGWNSTETKLHISHKSKYSQSSSSHVMKKIKVVANRLIYDKMIKEVRDSFNFKGYGVNVYKSLINRKSCGLAWRLPLTLHFDFFETRPWLPVFTSSCALYYPLRASVNLNSSLPVAMLKYIVLTIYDKIIFAINMIWFLITKIIIIDIIGIFFLSKFSKLLGFGTNNYRERYYNNRGKLVEMQSNFTSSLTSFSPPRPSVPKQRSVEYSSSVSERLGVSITWQITEERGVQLSWSWWHSYLPTIESILAISRKTINRNLYKSRRHLSTSNRHTAIVEEWLRQKVGSFGLTWGGFTPNPPFYSCSLLFTLSGFYHGGKTLKKLCSVPGLLLAVMENSKPKDEFHMTHLRKTTPTEELINQYNDIVAESEESDKCESIDIKVGAT